jgi:hypothetical protein
MCNMQGAIPDREYTLAPAHGGRCFVVGWQPSPLHDTSIVRHIGDALMPSMHSLLMTSCT